MRDRGGASLFPIAIPFVVAVMGYIYLAEELGIPFAIPVGIIGSIATAIALHGPIGKAIARRLEGAPAPGAELPAEQVLGELDELRQRLAEVEERVDFSERLLAQSRDSVDPR
jgi:hypothetical protein